MSLEKISKEDLLELRNKFSIDWPKYITAYYTIDNFLNWIDNGEDLSEVEFLSIGQNWRETGSFLIIDRAVLFFDTLDGFENNLKTLLLLVNYHGRYRISPYRMHLDQVVQEFVVEKGFEKYEEYVADFYYLSKEEAQRLETLSEPLDMACQHLEKSHAKIVDDSWSGKYQDSLYFMERLLTHNPALGLFDNEQNLVAWIVRREYGTIGNLHVLDEFRNRKFGALLSQKFTKFVAEKGFDICVSIFLDNIASHKIFEKLNFHKIDQNCRFKFCTKS